LNRLEVCFKEHRNLK